MFATARSWFWFGWPTKAALDETGKQGRWLGVSQTLCQTILHMALLALTDPQAVRSPSRLELHSACFRRQQATPSRCRWAGRRNGQKSLGIAQFKFLSEHKVYGYGKILLSMFRASLALTRTSLALPHISYRENPVVMQAAWPRVLRVRVVPPRRTTATGLVVRVTSV